MRNLTRNFIFLSIFFPCLSFGGQTLGLIDDNVGGWSPRNMHVKSGGVAGATLKSDAGYHTIAINHRRGSTGLWLSVISPANFKVDEANAISFYTDGAQFKSSNLVGKLSVEGAQAAFTSYSTSVILLWHEGYTVSCKTVVSNIINSKKLRLDIASKDNIYSLDITKENLNATLRKVLRKDCLP